MVETLPRFFSSLSFHDVEELEEAVGALLQTVEEELSRNV